MRDAGGIMNDINQIVAVCDYARLLCLLQYAHVACARHFDTTDRPYYKRNV